MIKREIALQIAWAWLGKPYTWGGDDPIEGFDCSGLIVEILKSVGILPRGGDWTAQGLWDRWPRTDQIRKGCLAYWGNKVGSIIHVEMCINSKLTIGASGGGSKTRTLDDAIRDNAFIKVRPINSRPGLNGFNDPFLIV